MALLTIEPTGVYGDGEVALALDVSTSALATARRRGELRYARTGKRTLYLGQWLLDWLERTGKPREEVATNG